MREIDMAEKRFNVVINQAGQKSIWEKGLQIPDGWGEEGIIGSKAHCLSEIEKLTNATGLQKTDNVVPEILEEAWCIHKIFERQAKKHPDAIAVLDGSKEITYAELNKKANGVAKNLKSVARTTSFNVAVCVERSSDLIVALLAVFKAGGVYVPLEPDLPDERLVNMFKQCDAQVLLTKRHLVDRFSTYSDVSICMDQVPPESMSDSGEGPNTILPAGHLSHIIFTSGSTGNPKGVLMQQGRLARNIKAFLNRVEVKPGDIYLHTASIAFTSSLRQFLAPLCSGASIVIANAEQRANPIALLRLIKEKGVTILDTVAAMLDNLNHAIIDLDGSTRKSLLNSNLRMVLSSGGKLPRQIPGQWRKHFPQHIRMVNMYGQTESAGNILIYDIPDHLPDQLDVVPLGEAIDGTQIHILDEGFNPVPPGVVGEICIGGQVISDGYLNLVSLTAEKFVPNPFSNKSGTRLYRSGDLGRWLPDGSIEYIGRSDFQVKIRGFRIEPEEVEAALLKMGGIAEAVVIGKDHPSGDTRLVAYIVFGAQEKRMPVPAIRSYLATVLPDYMIPSVLMVLDALPLMNNGKVDRQALPEPDQDRPDVEQDYQAPTSQTEKTIASIWSEVLGMNRIGVRDNFFDLGGHSLLATRVISRIRKEFELELSLRSLFESPTIAGMADRIDNVNGSDKGINSAPFTKASRDNALPLSFAQQRLWFLSQLDPDSLAYNIATGINFRGKLRLDILQKSLAEIVRRHEVLRTTFKMLDSQPVQIIHSPDGFELPVKDLQHPTQEDAQQIASQEARRPFDLINGPLFRACLLQLDPQDHLLVLSMHHIVSDGWSIDIVRHELEALYSAHLRNQPDVLPRIDIQYVDFAQWQRGVFTDKMLASQQNYWEGQLSEGLQTLQLPTDKPRPAVQTNDGANVNFSLSKALTAQLKQFSQQFEVTLFMTVLAAFKVLLYRYTRQTNFAVGTPIANRNQTEIEDLIGFFVNTLVLRTDIDGNPRFLDFLHRVRETTLDAYDHQDLPFEKLVEVISPERDMSTTPLFQVMIAFWNDRSRDINIDGLTFSQEMVDVQTSKFDLTLHLWEDDERLTGRMEYNTDLFVQETILRMSAHLNVIMESIIDTPQRRISEIPLLPEKEMRQILVEWNATQRDYPEEQTLVHMFEAQVLRTPDATAVESKTGRLTYHDLNERSNQLAHHLKKLGVGPEVVVGLFAERSLEMVIAMYGIIKAGGAYVPLDPEYPIDRVEFMMADTDIPVLITQQHLTERLPQYDAEVIILDADWDQIAKESKENPKAAASGKNAAYVIYTSGSTGKPKGVVNEHNGIVNRLIWMQEEYALTPDDRVLQKTPYSFDVSVWEFFWPLQVGATLIMADPGGHKDAGYLVDIIKQRGITTLHFVPSMLEFFLEEERVVECNNIKRVICSGEALSVEVQRKFFEKLDSELHNLYGPTEAAVDVTYWPCKRDDKRKVVPIGYPVANTQIYILDPDLQPVPIGCAGELHIGGIQVARGYLNRPNLTAEKFIKDPFSNQPGARLYKTGDLAKFTHDGIVEYLGRIDFQVKIRGLRVELGEIEAHIDEFEGIGKNVVTLSEYFPGEQILVAYYAVQQDSDVDISKLRKYLKSSLPDYMVPQHYIKLDAIPLSPNGKADRKALPKPKFERETDTAYVAPRNKEENIVAEVWKQLLRLDKVGIDDSFFDLGGHSLLLIKMLGKLKPHFERELKIIDFFRYPSIRALVKYLSHNEKNDERVQKAANIANRQKAYIKKQKSIASRRRNTNVR